MTHPYRLDSVLLPRGWAQNVRIDVADDGTISAIDESNAAGGELVRGFVVPGMANAHSHAFQRGMAGNTEFRRSAHDSFWTWRQAMYALANRIAPEDLQTLATQLFIEMLQAGYTSVAEFHYLHRQPDGNHYAEGHGLWEAITAAAEIAGIGLTLLPTLYQTSDFGGAPLKAEQRRFASETDWFLRRIEQRVGTERRAPVAAQPTAALQVATALPVAPALQRTGVAFHSLRAVPLATLTAAAQALRRMDPSMPLHIHVAEQLQEVASCRAHSGRRPIELLLDSGVLDAHWCLVHATHATAAELAGIAAAGAAVCVSITTEANLGDGFFDTARFLKLGGRLCVGSDSQATVCPAEELRWLEYQQRLRKKRRAVLADRLDAHVGTRLWRHAAAQGAQAVGQPAGALEVGRRADWIVLDPDHPSMAGATPDSALDHLLFAGGRAAIRDVMVGGRWVVQSGQHEAQTALAPRFLRLMQELAN